jgi:hypothetical protein
VPNRRMLGTVTIGHIGHALRPNATMHLSLWRGSTSCSGTSDVTPKKNTPLHRWISSFGRPKVTSRRGVKILSTRDELD